jgi:hypothetical protein
VHFSIASKRSLLRRFQHFIESNDWETYFCHKWIDKACIGAIVVSVTYFISVLMTVFMN